ncbi:MAG: MarR family transcriptional regulator [Clostridia bacterium]|nr:MarR family transcriptional regulator [Clostridia bacterium]
MNDPIAGYGWYIKLIDNALAKEANHNLQSHNLTMQQNRVLILLSHAPQMTLSLKELESHFDAAQSTVAGLVTRLERRGLIEGFADPGDKRVKLVRLTQEGLLLHQASRQDVVNSEKRPTSLLTEEEKEQFLRLLEKVYEAVK